MIRNQGDPNLTFVKTSSASGCVVPTAALGNLLAIIQQQPGAPVMAGVSGNPAAVLGACSGTYASLGVVPSDGVAANLKGNKLPDAPPWTLTLGAEYTYPLGRGWDATLRGDFYQQGQSFSRVFNDQVDRLEGWKNVNLSLRLTKASQRLEVEAYVKNLLDDRSVTGQFQFDDALGGGQGRYLLDPRIYGVSVSKRF